MDIDETLVRKLVFMVEEKKINVELYGGKSLFSKKEAPLVADEIYCTAYDECQLYAEGKCICCRALFDLVQCPYGRVVQTKGYTSRAAKYQSFRSKYHDDEVFSNLRHPKDMFLRLAGDYAYINLPGVEVSYLDSPDSSKRLSGTRFIGVKSNIRFGDPSLLSNSSCWIPKEELLVEDIAYMANFKPRAYTGEAIESYSSKTVPSFIDDIRHFWPDMYTELEKTHPDLCELEIDYRGRKAYLATLRPGIEIKDNTGNVFVFDGEKLVCDDYNNVLVRVGNADARHARIAIPVDDKVIVEIQDSSWVIPGKIVFA